ncbi:MAG TPA: serine hydrolase [Vicinamibacterales bacterium]|nr:serine hydrolase [Vicinamibacterales bacterium]
MKMAAAVAFAGVTAAVPAAQGARERTKVQGFSDAGKAALRQQIEDAVTRGDTPGVAEIVVNRAGVLYEAAAGRFDVAKGTPMATNAIFSIASMTKPVTSVAIMMLMEQGKLQLDDPVSKYLPGFDHLQVITHFNPTDASYQTRPAKTVMTIRHLLTHTSGIGYGFTNPVEYALTNTTKKGEWELPLLDDPGTKWHYSASTRVLGMIVEKVTGSTLEAWYHEHIFRPLGMIDTSYAVAADKQSRVPTQYTRATGTLAPLPTTPIAATPTPPFRGDGGLYSTVEDYGRFVRMLLNGGTLNGARILSERSVQMMGDNNIGAIVVERQPDADKARTKPFPLGAGKDKFGLGFQLAADDPSTKGFRSPGSMSWAGIFNTEFWIDPVKHMGAVQMMQVLPFYDDGAIRTLRGFEQLVYKTLQ